MAEEVEAVTNLFAGNKVTLRALEPNDALAVYQWGLDSETVRLADRVSFPRSLGAIQQRLQSVPPPFSDDHELGIEAEGRLVGLIQLFRTERRDRTAWLGVLIGDRLERGKGYGTEAIRLLMRFAFRELNYQKVNLNVFSFNPRAIAIYEKMGFIHEGRIRRTLYADGQYHDQVLMGMIAEEFEVAERAWESRGQGLPG